MKVLQWSFGTTKFPHSIDPTSTGALKIIFDPADPIEVGQQFMLTYQSDKTITILSVDNVRPAKGDWTASGIAPMYCECTFN